MVLVTGLIAVIIIPYVDIKKYHSVYFEYFCFVN